MTFIESFQNMRIMLAEWITCPGAGFLVTLIMLLAVGVCSVAGYYITRGLLRCLAIVVEKTETDWDDDLINASLLKAISQLAPALIISWLLPYCFAKSNGISAFLNILTSYYIIVVTVMAINRFLDNLLHALTKREKFRPYAVKGIFQMLKLIFMGIGIIVALSLLIGKSPIAILTALGASAAVLMLVFRDTILGLVAGIQLTANKMVHKGDWIVVPKHNANGEVTDISLTTVKIRNWDNSITTVPPYSLVSESFQNYQAMRRSGARRVCRSVYIDMNGVRFLTHDEIARLREEGWLEGIEIPENGVASNLRLIREYLELWLSRQQHVRNDLTYMVRQMDPTPNGLPLELYFFINQVAWKEFEHIQSDIFDHVYAIASHFHLRLFQTPSGLDLLALSPMLPKGDLS